MYTKIFIGVVIGAAILGAGLAFIVGSEPDPQTLLFDALENLSVAEILEATAHFNVVWLAPTYNSSDLFSQEKNNSVKEEGFITHTISGSITQLLSFKTEKQKQIKTNILIRYKSQDVPEPVQIQIEAIGTTEKFYTRIQGVQDTLASFGLPISLTGIENTWIEIIPTEVEESPLLGDVNGTSTVENKLSALDKRNVFLDILRNHAVVKQIEIIGKEAIEEYKTYHLQLILDESEMKKAFAKMGEEISNTEPPIDMKDNTKTYIKSLDVWIDVDSHQLRMVSLSLDPEALKEEDDRAVFQEASVRITDIKQDEFFTFTPPDSARKLEDVFGEIMQGLFGGIMNEKKP